jgi:hypothetical protein
MRPVFIVGEARSGTSILYRSLQNHPSFTPKVGTQLVESKAMEHLPMLFAGRPVTHLGLANFLQGPEGLDAVADDVEPLARRRRIVRRLSGRYWRHPFPWRMAGEHHVVRRYFLEAEARRGAVRLLEKTPQNIGWVPHLKVAMPRSQFVYVVRHPVDVLTSYWRRYATEPEKASWANIGVDDFCRLWAGNARLAHSLDRRDPTFLLIRYEDFTTDTEGTVRRVLEHLGEPYDEACLLRERRPTWSIKDDRWVTQPINARTKDWIDYVDEAVAGSVERSLRETMALFGYEPRVAPGAPAQSAAG